MTAKELEDKCLALMEKLGLMDDEEKLEEWVREYAVFTEDDELVVKKRSEIDVAVMEINSVLCAVYDPSEPSRYGTKIQHCHDCCIPIVVSHDAPIDPPKLCRDCSLKRHNKEEP